MEWPTVKDSKCTVTLTFLGCFSFFQFNYPRSSPTCRILISLTTQEYSVININIKMKTALINNNLFSRIPVPT